MWDKNSILTNYNPSTPCADIFEAFCDELGKYYVKKGMKYSKSVPEIIFDNNRLRIELSFNSARFNTPGQTVMVELGVSIIDLELDKKEPVFNNFTLFSKKLKNAEPGTIRVESIFGEQTERKETNKEAEFRFSNCFNIYAIDLMQFKQVTTFLDEHIFNWIEDIYEADKVAELIHNLGSWGRWFSNQQLIEQFLELRHKNVQWK